MKRFTDTGIWDQDWFIYLPNKYKLFWFYVKDQCDNAGFWRPNKSILESVVLKEKIKIDDFLSLVNSEKERIKIMPGGRWFIKDFFVFQYGDKFSPSSQVHKGILKTLCQNGVHISEVNGVSCGDLQNLDLEQIKLLAYSKDIKTLTKAYGNPYERVKDKDKDSLNNNKNGVKFNEEKTIVYFSDGTYMELSKMQQMDAQTLPASHFQKGLKY